MSQQRTCDHDLVVQRELADQVAGCVGERGKSIGDVGTDHHVGARHEFRQNAVEEFDMLGAEACRAFEKQLSDPPRRFVTTIWIVTPDDFIEPGDQRCRECHSTYSTRPCL